MTDHINSIARKATIALRYSSKLRHLLDKSSTEKLVHAFVSSHLDCNNILLLGLPAYMIQKVQRLQNSAAIIVSRLPYRDHITPQLRDLHWLPVSARVEYKVLLTVFKCLNSLAPSFISSMLHVRQHGRVLRSSDTNLLVEPRFKLQAYGSRSFCVMAPRMWNRLPAEIRRSTSLPMFTRSLKTLLFIKYYGQT